MDNLKIRNRFSRYAHTYEHFDFLQRRLGDRLFSELSKYLGPPDVLLLDVGTGTGRLLESIKRKFPGIGAWGLDLSERMLNKASEKELLSTVMFLQADAQYIPFKDNSFDFVASNSAYHWVNDLPLAFLEANRVLKKEGVFFFSVFGAETLKELKFCVEKVRPGCNFFLLPDSDKLEENLAAAGFRDIELICEARCDNYTSITEILNWLKYTGTSYSGGPFFTGLGGRSFISRLRQLYESYFRNANGLAMTYELVLARARK